MRRHTARIVAACLLASRAAASDLFLGAAAADAEIVDDGSIFADPNTTITTTTTTTTTAVPGTTITTTTTSPTPVLMIDLFRAMEGDAVDKQTEQNDDLASLGGVLKYIHTEVIPESGQSQGRIVRKYNIDTIVKRRYLVKNPPMDHAQVNLVDFGPFVTYDLGQSTNQALDATIQTIGDFVGVAVNNHVGLVTTPDNPYYWFSAGGFCPNLPWIQVDATMSARCKNEKLCQPKGTSDKPDPMCLKYAKAPLDNTVIKGGLCGPPDLSSEVPSQRPTGEAGCSYTYGKANKVSLDDLVGISQQKCNKGKACKDWFDFRHNCDDDNLKKMFDGRGRIIVARNTSDNRPFCVEYDVHPKCQGGTGCADPDCQAIKAGTAEIGLPFWKDRCDPARNRWRFEQLAEMFGITDATKKHQITADDVKDQEFPCYTPQQAMPSCKPSTDSDLKSKGFPYCSRTFSGVCQTCTIPGTKYPDPGSNNIMCPLNIVQRAEYQDPSGQFVPNCKSQKPSDICCLYTGDCDGDKDPAKATLDDDGLTLVAASCGEQRDSAPMLAYMQRIAKEMFNSDLDTTKDEVKQYAYWQWGEVPGKTAFDSLKDKVKEFAPPVPVTTPSPSPSGGGDGGSGGGSKTTIIIIVVVAVAAVVLGGVGFFVYQRNQNNARRPALLA